ncbi:MAG: TetR/AcrR family transcriptional regulator [Pseudomonadota bacterium]
MRSFWAQGYDGTSVDTMCRVTGMSRASLYQSYGGKEGLFLAAVAHYAETRAALVTAALGPKGSLVEDLAAFFDAVVDLGTADPETPGCLVSCVLADAAGASAVFRKELERRQQTLEDRIADRLRVSAWPEDADVSLTAAAGLAAAAARGIMIRARSGQPRDALRAVASAAALAVAQLSL